MAILTTKNFTTLVQEWAAVCQSSVAAVFPTQVLSFTKGAVFRALAEAQASVSLWLEALILQLLTATRLQTSKGVDVDTFVADFMPPAPGGAAMPDGRISPRLPANASTGLVTFSRATPSNAAVIPIGATVQSTDGSQTFAVYADPTNSAYSANAGGPGIAGYTIAAQVASLSVGVKNLIPGALGNVQAGVVTIIQTGMSGIDTVTNAGPFTNGFNSESDAALKARFVLYINSLAKATEGALAYAVQSIQQGMQYQIYENQDVSGATDYGMVTMYVDDGSGAIPPTTLAAANLAAQAVRAAGVRLGVYADSILLANVTMSIATAPGYYHPTVVAQVVAAITSFINGLGLATTPAMGQVSYIQLGAVAFGVQGVTDVTNYQLNGVTVDLVPAAGVVIKSGTVIVS